MSYKKTALRIGILALLMTAGVVAYLYYRYHRPSDLPYYVPADAEHVVFVSTKKFIMAMQTAPEKPKGSLLDSIRKIKYFRNVNDPRDIGLNLFTDIVLYAHKGNGLAVLEMNNEEVFTAFVKEKTPAGTFGAVTDKKTFRYCFASEENFALAWTKAVAVIVFNAKTIEQNRLEAVITEAIEPKPKNSIMEQAVFKSMSDKADAFCVLYTTQPDAVKYLSDGTVKKAAAYLAIKDNTLTMNGVLAFDGVSDSELQKGNTAEADTNAGAEAYINTKETFVRNWIDRYFHSEVNAIAQKSIDPNGTERHRYIDVLMNEFKGGINMVYDGNKLQKTSFTRYEYDDNFNQKQVVTTKTDTIPVFKAFFDMTYDQEFKSFYDNAGLEGFYLFFDKSNHYGPGCITNDSAYTAGQIKADMKKIKPVTGTMLQADINVEKLKEIELLKALPTANLRHIFINFASPQNKAATFKISLQFEGFPFSGLSELVKGKAI